MRTIILAGMFLLCPFQNLLAQSNGVQRAEDLWGNSVPFDRIIHSRQTTVIQPFSASNCGYCMIDGWFVEKNFFETNREKGGVNFTQCLFNPQLDVYSFTKHYRDTLTPVLTWPPELHRYHQDGFPVILAFRNGEQVVKLPAGSLYPYDSTFEKLKMTLWNDTSVHFQPVADLQFATRIIYENMHYSAICVVPDGNQRAFDANLEFAKRAKCYRVIYFNQLSAQYLVKNVMLEGRFARGAFRYIAGGNSPFRLEGDSVLCFGRYRLGVDSIGISACIPNPLNTEKYMVMKIRGLNVEKGFFDNSVDYTIYGYDNATQSTRVLLHGFFDKQPGNRWLFSDSLCISHLNAKENCVGVCMVPAKKFFPENQVIIKKPRYRKTSTGKEYTFGNNFCRFPSIVADDKGTAWVCWEERGDILLSSVDRDHSIGLAIEHDRSDSYNPLITFSGGKLWVFYLNNRDGFYRVYGRSFDGSVLTSPVLYSELLPCDVVTPSVVSTKSGIVLAWTYWKSNFRFPFYRAIRNGIPDSVHAVPVAKSASLPDYTNAWYFSLDTDTTGVVWGAWNQHYPATLGICAGNLLEAALPVTRVAENMDDCENGGYPCAIHDEKGRRWVFWESFSWSVLDGDRQKIRGSMFDPEVGAWAPSFTLPEDENTCLNQTPQAVAGGDGKIYVTWSGRSKNGTWDLYLVCRDKDMWGSPVRLTSGKEPARAPKIITDNRDGVWVACHYGTGKKMKVKLFRLFLSR